MVRVKRFGAALLVAAAAVGAPQARAGGFAINEKGSKATAMGGAFSALADDPSAMYYNPAGLAGNDKLTVMAGVTLIPYFSKFEGDSPFPGAGYRADMKKQIFFPPQLYVAYPVAKDVNVAFGVWAPFGLSTAWENPDDFRGRFLSQRVDLRQFAIGLQGSFKLTDWLAVGGGPELRTGDVKLQRNAGVFNPFVNRFVDFAHVDVVGEGFQSKITWGAGVQIKPVPRLTLGGSFHAHADVDFTGSTIFYQISTGSPQLDAVLGTRIPFDKKVPTSTSIQFPSLTQFGAAFDVCDTITVEVDGDYTTWKVFDQTILRFDEVDGKKVPDSVLTHNWENTWTFRAGVNFRLTPGFNVAAGYLYDQTPQPDADVSPLLPDSNRTGYSIGLGLKLGKTVLEASNLFLFFHDRPTNGNQKDNFNGTYKTFADLFVLNLRHSF